MWFITFCFLLSNVTSTGNCCQNINQFDFRHLESWCCTEHTLSNMGSDVLDVYFLYSNFHLYVCEDFINLSWTFPAGCNILMPLTILSQARLVFLLSRKHKMLLQRSIMWFDSRSCKCLSGGDKEWQDLFHRVRLTVDCSSERVVLCIARIKRANMSAVAHLLRSSLLNVTRCVLVKNEIIVSCYFLTAVCQQKLQTRHLVFDPIFNLYRGVSCNNLLFRHSPISLRSRDTDPFTIY